MTKQYFVSTLPPRHQAWKWYNYPLISYCIFSTAALWGLPTMTFNLVVMKWYSNGPSTVHPFRRYNPWWHTQTSSNNLTLWPCMKCFMVLLLYTSIKFWSLHCISFQSNSTCPNSPLADLGIQPFDLKSVRLWQGSIFSSILAFLEPELYVLSLGQPKADTQTDGCNP